MARVIKKKVKIGDDLSNMFNQMLGTDNAQLPICYPKYEKLMDILGRYIKLLGIMVQSPPVNHPSLTRHAVEITKYIEWAKEEYKKHFSFVLDPTLGYMGVSETQHKQWSDNYHACKKSKLVLDAIDIFNTLYPYRSSLDTEPPSYRFIDNLSVVDFVPFTFSSMDIKYVFTMDAAIPSIKSLVVSILSKLYKIGSIVNETIASPDINIDDVIKVIRANIDSIRNRPELHRCTKAFDKILNSLHLLKDNFTGYYRDFIKTQNSTIIMEHFILDVSKNANVDLETTRQFRHIIEYYRGMAKHQINNPRVKHLFEQIDSNFTELERHTGNIVNIKEDV